MANRSYKRADNWDTTALCLLGIKRHKHFFSVHHLKGGCVNKHKQPPSTVYPQWLSCTQQWQQK